MNHHLDFYKTNFPYTKIKIYLCSLSFYRNQTTGGWSNEGIIQDDDPRSPVMCNSTHLTSFAVLVSAEGGNNFAVSNCFIM